MVHLFNERLTNSCYADDIFVYAKSLDEAIFMMRILVNELEKVGLNLNAPKNKFLHGHIEDDGYDVAFMNIGDEFIEIHYVATTHEYIGKLLTIQTYDRSQCEILHRSQSA